MTLGEKLRYLRLMEGNLRGHGRTFLAGSECIDVTIHRRSRFDFASDFGLFTIAALYELGPCPYWEPLESGDRKE